jgi:hypothetical protein
MAPNAPNLQALLNMAPSAFAGGDIGKLPVIRSLSDLRKEVERWAGDESLGKLTQQDLEALVNWFNRNFFRLED